MKDENDTNVSFVIDSKQMLVDSLDIRTSKKLQPGCYIAIFPTAGEGTVDN